LWSYTVYKHAFASKYVGQLPYAVGLVELDDGPRVYARLQGDPRSLDTTTIGAPVTLIVEHAEDAGLLRFSLVESTV
jgi:uncharacterized OB-fold protein